MAKQEQKKPNILVIWGDDIGWSNLSCYNLGVMDIVPPTSTASQRKARFLPTLTVSNPARRVARLLSSVSILSAPGC